MYRETKELPAVEAVPEIGVHHVLAEAIRRGCAMSKPLRGSYICGSGDNVSACALGAALIGFGVLRDEYDIIEMPLLADELTRLGVTPELQGRIGTNNDGGMPRERIADWLCQTGGCRHGLLRGAI